MRRRWLLLGARLAPVLLAAGCGGSSHTNGSHISVPSNTLNPTPSTSTRAPGVPAGAGSASATASSTAHEVSASAAGVTATMRAGTHTPAVEAPWPVHFTVVLDGRPAHASVSYEYLLGEQVVAHRSHYTFKGSFSDIFKWPADAVGYPLTFRAVIVAGKTKIDLGYPIQVTR